MSAPAGNRPFSGTSEGGFSQIFIVDLRFCSSADAGQIALLEEQCSPSPWSRSIIERDLSGNAPYLYLGAWGTSRLLGFAVLTRKSKKAALANIAVLPFYRRRGIATQLLLGISETALFMEFTRMILSVRSGNEGAMHFYKKAGFRFTGRERGYYSNGEDALELEALLPISFPEG